jgi:hypothetical protein
MHKSPAFEDLFLTVLAGILLTAPAVLPASIPADSLRPAPTPQLGNSESKLGIYAAEFGAALGGSVCCGGATVGLGTVALIMALGQAFNEEPPRWETGAILVGALTTAGLLPAVSAAGAWQVGRRYDPGGSYLGALTGSVLGCGVGIGTGFGIRALAGDPSFWYFAIPTVLGAAAGSVVGYDLSRGFERRWAPPTAAMEVKRLHAGRSEPRLRMNLLAARF